MTRARLQGILADGEIRGAFSRHLPRTLNNEAVLPPAAKELVASLLERLDRFEASLAALNTSVTRILAGEEQAREAANEARRHAEALDERVTELEASKHRAEGAVWAWRVAVAALAAAGGAASHVLLGK